MQLCGIFAFFLNLFKMGSHYMSELEEKIAIFLIEIAIKWLSYWPLNSLCPSNFHFLYFLRSNAANWIVSTQIWLFMSEENTILYLEKWCYIMALCWALQPENLGPLTIEMLIRYLWTRPKQWKLKCNPSSKIEWEFVILVKCYKSAQYWAIQPYLMLKTIFLKSHHPNLSTRIGQEYPNHLQESLVFSKLQILGELKNMSLYSQHSQINLLTHFCLVSLSLLGFGSPSLVSLSFRGWGEGGWWKSWEDVKLRPVLEIDAVCKNTRLGLLVTCCLWQ